MWAIVWGQYTHAPWVAGIGAGVIAGLCLSITWTVRPLIGPLAVLHAFTALLALTSAWLATPRATLWASAVALFVIMSWVIGYHERLHGFTSEQCRGYNIAGRYRDPHCPGSRSTGRHGAIDIG